MAEDTTQRPTYSKSISSPVAVFELDGIKALFFDLDNTLIPTRSGDLKAIRKLADVLENQFAFTREESTASTQSFLKSFRRCPDNSQTSLESWRTYLWRESLPMRHKCLAERIYPKWLQLRYRYLALQPEYAHMLRHFREVGYSLALITNGPSNSQWEKINKLHVSQYFDCVLVSSDLPWEKPNPHIFHAACNFLGVKATACVMIGDKLGSDIKGGCLAGLGATFWLPINPAEMDLTDVVYPPDIILRQLMDLYKYFSALNNNTTSNISTTNTSSIAITHSQSTRRISQLSFSFCDRISGNPTTSTWKCDVEPYQQGDPRQYHQQQRNQQHNNGCNKYRSGSLPTMDCFNSEAENSSDSLFS